MTVAILISACILASGCFAGLAIGLVFMLVRQQRGYEAELARSHLMWTEALARVQAKNVVEYTNAKSAEKAADLQLKMLEDALAIDKDKKAKMEKEFNPEPRMIRGFDAEGKPVEVDINDGSWQIVE